MNAVEKELLKATAAKAQGKSESRQVFLTRLGKAVNELGEDDYEALSDEAVTWYEAAVKAVKAKKALPDFEEPEAEQESEADEPEADEPKAIKKPGGKKAPAKKAPAKKAGVRNMAFSAEMAIVVLAKQNPKRPGSVAHDHFELYKSKKTVGAFLKAGGTRADLRWDAAQKFIKVS